MGWIYVLIASSLEISGVIGLKLFSQKKNLPNLVLFASGFALSSAEVLLFHICFCISPWPIWI